MRYSRYHIPLAPSAETYAFVCQSCKFHDIWTSTHAFLEVITLLIKCKFQFVRINADKDCCWLQCWSRWLLATVSVYCELCVIANDIQPFIIKPLHDCSSTSPYCDIDRQDRCIFAFVLLSTLNLKFASIQKLLDSDPDRSCTIAILSLWSSLLRYFVFGLFSTLNYRGKYNFASNTRYHHF